MSNQANLIRTPADSKLGELCEAFASLSESLHAPASYSPLDAEHDSNDSPPWPGEQLRLAGEFGVHAWFIPQEFGGLGWSAQEIVEGYLQLSASCLTTTFIITQRAAAIKRILASENLQLKQELMPGLLTGESAATVGISHLTTSRQHVRQPVLIAEERENGFVLNGYSPWVTGGCGADFIVIGAELDDGKQVLFALPKSTPGVTIAPGIPLLGLNASQTGAVRCDQVSIDAHYLLAGPQENVLASGPVSATGGFQTSALATGLAIGAIEFIRQESQRRSNLVETYESFQRQLDTARQDLLDLAAGNLVCTKEELRINANSLVLRATQAAMVAAKGAGYVAGHRAGRWCQEALFFLVWSCPQAVADANLCELAGMEA